MSLGGKTFSVLATAFLEGMAILGLVIMALFGIPPITDHTVEGSPFPTNIVPNPKGVYIGAYPFSSTSDIESTQLDFNRSPLKLVKTYRAWFEYGNPDSYLDFDIGYKPNFDFITASGSIVYLNWDAWDGVSTNILILDEINRGEHDQFIKSVAARIRDDYGAHQVLIDLFHEPNGDWYPWSPELGTSARGHGKKYKNFRDAYRRVRELFDGQNVTNVTWVLSFNTDTINASSNFTEYFPGDAYVDWIGLDGYNQGTSEPRFSWRTFDQVMEGNSDAYTQASSFGKPLVLAEFASAEQGGDKAAWIEDAFARIGSQYDFVGFIWFNIDSGADWRINSSPAALEAFQKSMSYECYLDGLDQGGPNPGCPAVSNDPATSLHVAALRGTLHQVGTHNLGQAEVWVKDGNGVPAPVEGVAVKGSWSGLDSKQTTSTTDAAGFATSRSDRTKSAGCFVYEVTDLVKAGYTYDPTADTGNKVTICTGN